MPKPLTIEAPALVVPPVADSKLDTRENKASQTTVEQDLKTKGQRHINLIWEVTQAVIAIGVTGANVYAALNKIESQALSNAFILVVSMYLVRTNHTKIGGISGADSR